MTVPLCQRGPSLGAFLCPGVADTVDDRARNHWLIRAMSDQVTMACPRLCGQGPDCYKYNFDSWYVKYLSRRCTIWPASATGRGTHPLVCLGSGLRLDLWCRLHKSTPYPFMGTKYKSTYNTNIQIFILILCHILTEMPPFGQETCQGMARN